MRAIVAALLLLAALRLVATAAPLSAQEPLAEARGASSSMFSAAIFRSLVIPVRPAVLQGLHQAELAGSRLPAGTLRFTRTWKVEKDARSRLLDSLFRTSPDPEAREAIEESVTGGDPWREFDQTLTFAGYSSSNLADVTTAYYVITWQVVSGEQAIDFLPGIRRVRDSVALALLHDPGVAALSDAEKQEAAVVMAYKAIVAAHRARELRRSNDRSGLARLRQEVRDSVVRGQGVDLAALRLTNLGFVAD